MDDTQDMDELYLEDVDPQQVPFLWHFLRLASALHNPSLHPLA